MNYSGFKLLSSLIGLKGNKPVQTMPGGGGDEDITQLTSPFLQHNYIWHEYASVNTLESLFLNSSPADAPLCLFCCLCVSPSAVLIRLFPFLNCLPSSLPLSPTPGHLLPPGPRDSECRDRDSPTHTQKINQFCSCLRCWTDFLWNKSSQLLQRELHVCLGLSMIYMELHEN